MSSLTASSKGFSLRPGEQLVLHDRESRLVRCLADAFVCVAAMFIGVAFNAFVFGTGASGSLSVLVTIALTLAPIFLFMSTRPLIQVVLTNQRIFIGPTLDDLDSAEYHQIDNTRLWLATLFIRLRNGETRSAANLRTLYAIEAYIAEKQAA